ncbi:MAG: HAD-IA family hydrolase [Candidatus Omnitrophica bacterium]|nr:HAD-IA family hydrolase [Candidatus Omnitrophota bacterium]
MKNMLKDYDAIFLDAGGTLLYPYPSVGEIYAEVALKYGCRRDAGDLNQSFKDVWHRHDGLSELQSHSDEKKERDFWHRIVAEVFGDFSESNKFNEFFSELYDLFATSAVWRLYPETLEVLKAFKSLKACVAIVSNWDSRLMHLCDEFGISEHVHFILASAVFGAAKPSTQIFDEALRRSGISRTKTLHVGDSLSDDVQGARRAGIRPVLLDRHDRLAQGQVENRDFLIIRSLHELL